VLKPYPQLHLSKKKFSQGQPNQPRNDWDMLNIELWTVLMISQSILAILGLVQSEWVAES
jgi:hypothetical protein